MTHPNTQLSSDTLRWVAAAVGPDAAILSARQLAGATSSVLHSIDVQCQGSQIPLVLRRFVTAAGQRGNCDAARHEAESLKKASQAGVPTPELIACDEDGAWCGAPAVLMTRLPGAVVLKPRNLDDWLHRQAEAILPFHAIDVGAFSWHYAPYNDVAHLEAPAWSSIPELWEKAIEIVNGPWPGARVCFIHRDYHPTNVLWLGERVSGVVDWVNGCRGSANIDVAWCRGNLIHLHGIAAADRFLHAYQSLAGSSFEYHPFWDLMVIIEVLPGPPRVYPPWITFGATHLSSAMMCERLDTFLTHVMVRFDR